jgi:hypothetical protein
MSEVDTSLNEILDLALTMANQGFQITKKNRTALQVIIQNHFHRFPKASQTSPVSL